MDYNAEYRNLRKPTITEEEYISMRMSGIMISEMASYDLMPPRWIDALSKKLYTKDTVNGYKRIDENQRYHEALNVKQDQNKHDPASLFDLNKHGQPIQGFYK